MKKILMVFTGTLFLFGLTLSAGYGQYKKEKQNPTNPIPSQDTIHLEKTDDKKIKEMQKEIDSLKSQQKAPAAAQTAPPTAETKAAVTAPAKETAPAAADTKKAKKTKKDKKDKKNKTN